MNMEGPLDLDKTQVYEKPLEHIVEDVMEQDQKLRSTVETGLEEALGQKVHVEDFRWTGEKNKFSFTITIGEAGQERRQEVIVEAPERTER